MTLVQRLSDPKSSFVEVNVHPGWSSYETWCPNCRHRLQVDLNCGEQCRTPLSPCTPTTTMLIEPFSRQSPLPQRTSQFLHSKLNEERLRHQCEQERIASIVLSLQCSEERRLASQYDEPRLHLRKLEGMNRNVYSDPVAANTLRVLELSGWYYGELDWQGAQNLLKEARIGTFLVRKSCTTAFYSLSLQTEKGPTSVRLHYSKGYYRFDCDVPLERYMPRFRCLIELVQYYTRNGAGTVWVDQKGCTHSPVLLKGPLRKNPPSLMHCARLAVHKVLDSDPLSPKLWCAPKHRHLPLPPTLIDYLTEYPYSI